MTQNIVIHKLQINHERSMVELDDPSIDFDFSNIKEVYTEWGSSYPAPIGVPEDEWIELYTTYYDDIYDMDLGIEYDFGIGSDIIAMVTNDGELIEMYDNPIPATIETPWEMHTRMEVDSYKELSNKINGELLSAAFDDLRTGMEL
mgnify:CR=1 FL=1